ncbi:hypothetical protein L1887_49695 [Cichorium endivia]|nr:hypothetical protein L1887_49695 [Cichorium endivia]
MRVAVGLDAEDERDTLVACTDELPASCVGSVGVSADAAGVCALGEAVVLADGESEDAVGEALLCGDAAAGPCVPGLDGVVCGGGGEERGAGVEGDAGDGSVVHDLAAHLCQGEVPDDRLAFGGGGDDVAGAVAAADVDELDALDGLSVCVAGERCDDGRRTAVVERTDVDDAHVTGGTADDDDTSVGRDGELSEAAVDVGLDLGGDLGRLWVPDDEGAIFGAGDETLAVGGEAAARDCVAVAGEDVHDAALGELPHPDGGVGAAGGEHTALGMPVDPDDLIGAFKVGEELPRLEVVGALAPDAHLAVHATCGCEVAGGVEERRGDAVGVAAETDDFRAVLSVPDPAAIVFAAAERQGRVGVRGMERDGEDRLAVRVESGYRVVDELFLPGTRTVALLALLASVGTLIVAVVVHGDVALLVVLGHYLLDVIVGEIRAVDPESAGWLAGCASAAAARSTARLAGASLLHWISRYAGWRAQIGLWQLHRPWCHHAQHPVTGALRPPPSQPHPACTSPRLALIASSVTRIALSTPSSILTSDSSTSPSVASITTTTTTTTTIRAVAAQLTFTTGN